MGFEKKVLAHSVQTAQVKKVIFAGDNFAHPFSHRPWWLQGLRDRGFIYTTTKQSYIFIGNHKTTKLVKGSSVKLLKCEEVPEFYELSLEVYVPNKGIFEVVEYITREPQVKHSL
jgi:hypothetical protein